MSVVAEAVIVLAAATGAAAGVAALPRPARAGPLDARDQSRLRRDPRPAQFVRLEHIVESSAKSGSSAHARLRPLIVEIAEARLVRRGLSLGRDVEEAQRLLGPAVWTLVRPDCPAPQGRDLAGISPRRLGEILDALEAL
jgi:hypothetical protein